MFIKVFSRKHVLLITRSFDDFLFIIRTPLIHVLHTACTLSYPIKALIADLPQTCTLYSLTIAFISFTDKVVAYTTYVFVETFSVSLFSIFVEVRKYDITDSSLVVDIGSDWFWLIYLSLLLLNCQLKCRFHRCVYNFSAFIKYSIDRLLPLLCHLSSTSSSFVLFPIVVFTAPGLKSVNTSCVLISISFPFCLCFSLNFPLKSLVN